jgi:hypothetical protein
MWADLNLPNIPPWPQAPYSLDVIEVNVDRGDREGLHDLREMVRMVKGSLWPSGPGEWTGAGDVGNGAIRLMNDRLPGRIVDDFRRLFGRGMAYVPGNSRSDITTYWRKATAPEGCQGKPNAKTHYDPHVKVDAWWGVPKTDGHVLYFPIPALVDMGEESAIVAIAHELAHVTFYAAGEPNHWPAPDDVGAYAEAEAVDRGLKEGQFRGLGAGRRELPGEASGA